MDFRLSDEQEQLKATAERFAREEMSEVAKELEANNTPLSAEWREGELW